jgi:hypothetical protein
MLQLRCPQHLEYDGKERPPQACRDCWELFRIVHEDKA